MKSTLQPVIFAFLLVALAACNNPRYINSPSVHNAAFFKQKGDYKLSGAFAFNPNNTFKNLDTATDRTKNLGADLQAAFALTDHFLISVGGMMRSENDHFRKDDLTGNNRRSQIQYNRSMLDIGAGFYTAMGASQKVFFNGVLGAGFGSMSSKDRGFPNERLQNYDANFIKYYLSPSFNFFFSDYFKMSLAPRVSLLNFQNIRTSYTAENEAMLGYETMRKGGKFLFEPSLLLQSGFRNLNWLKLDFGFNFASNPLESVSDRRMVAESYEVRSRNFLISLGISVYPFHR